MSSDWLCEQHGAVAPYTCVPRPSTTAARQLAGRAAVPLWTPLPLLPGWTLAGLATAGDDRTGARATATAFGGPCPLGGPADLVLVAEEPGLGLGGRLAGTSALDPGSCSGAPDAKIISAGHPTPLWRAPSAHDRVAFAGEALGVWLWEVLWPPAAELVLLEHVELHDLRAQAHEQLDLPVGAATTRLDEALPPPAATGGAGPDDAVAAGA